jgi:hypothetical protein
MSVAVGIRKGVLWSGVGERGVSVLDVIVACNLDVRGEK